MILTLLAVPAVFCLGAQQTDIVATRPGALQDMQLAVYDVADLVDPLAQPGRYEREVPMTDEERTAGRVALRKELNEDIRRWMEPTFTDQLTLEFTSGGALVANLTPDRQKWLNTFLGLQRGRTEHLYTLSSQFLLAEPKWFDRFEIKEQTRLLPAVEGQHPIIAAVLAQPDVSVLTAPIVSVFPRQRATISILNQTAYVRDYEYVVVAPGNQEILDPIIDVIQDGVALDTRIVPLPGDRYGLTIDALFSDLKKPIATEQVTIAPGTAPVTIGLPELRKVRLQTRTQLAMGETLVVSGRAQRPDGTISSPFTIEESDGVKRELILTVRIDEIQIVESDPDESADAPVEKPAASEH